MKSKVAIIGGGISGLSLGQKLKNKYDVTIFEAASRPGGLIKCDRIEGNLYHRTGGHVFNTKRHDVLDWFWSFFDKDEEFTKAKRNASISISKEEFIPYPIENNVHLLDEKTVQSVIQDLLYINKSGSKTPENFKEFLLNQFGQTLFDIYFKPYNEKIWQCDLSTIPLSWLEGKLPMPTVNEILFSNIKKVEESNFVHSSFYYPKQDGSQFLVDRLSKGLNIQCNSKIETLVRKDDKWNVNGIIADKVIFCGNIKQIPSLLSSNLNLTEFIAPIEELEYHGTTTVLCEIEHNPYSWVYIPNEKLRSHRVICTGNFAETNNAKGKTSATIEFTDEISIEEIKCNLTLMPFSPKYLAHHFEPYTYPIQNKTTRQLVSALKSKLEKDNIYLLGRFAEWEYYNMDIAVGAALDLSKQIQNESKKN